MCNMVLGHLFVLEMVLTKVCPPPLSIASVLRDQLKPGPSGYPMFRPSILFFLFHVHLSTFIVVRWLMTIPLQRLGV
jgi:hypothetical protein